MKYIGILFFIFLANVCFSQTTIYYVDKNEISDSKYFLNYFESLTILDSNCLLLITNDNHPYLFKGADIKRNVSLIENIRNNSNDDSLEVSLLCENILKNLLLKNTVYAFRFYLSKNTILKDSRDFYYRIPNKLILAINIEKNIDFKIYFMIQDGELTIEEINTLNRNNKSYEIQIY